MKKPLFLLNRAAKLALFIYLFLPALAFSQVTLTDQGTKVVLDNGIVKATIEKSSAKILSLIYRGVETTMQGTNHSGAYYSWNGGNGFGAPGGCVYSIKRQDANLVDVSCKFTYSGAGSPMDGDYHFVLKTGDSELYLYNTIEHKSTYPALDLGEYRLVVWLGPDPANGNEWLFENTYHGDGVRDFQLPSIFDYNNAAATGIGEIVKLTTGVRSGLYDSKYEYSTALWEHPVIGNASSRNDKGIFALFPSLEYFNEGPMYHDLVNGGDIIHIYMNGDHYDGATINVPAGQSYKKFFGPFALYLNNKTDGATAFEDAKARQKTEAAAWPFTWLNYNTDYPQASARGAVSGVFDINDSAKPNIGGSGAWIGVTQIASTNTRNDFMFESNNYHYWVKVKNDGSFTIPNVRPGTYKLFAYQDGEVGQFERTNVTVTAGGNNNLGTVTWNIPRTSGNLVWEIGSNNRSSKEFRFGSDKYFAGFTQELIRPNYTNPLVYTVANKDWASKLNYAHIGYPNTSGGNDTWRWNLNFNLSNLPATGNATLTIAYASAGGASEGVFVNSATQFVRFYPPEGMGNAFVRQSNFGKYSFYKVSIPVANLINGANTIGLEISPNGHVMYDYISLEVPGATGAGTTLDGNYVITARNSGRAVEVAGQSLANAAAIDQYSNNGGSNQRWIVSSVGGGYYSIINANSGKAMDVEGGSLIDSAHVIQWPYSGATNQQWTITSLGNGYYKIINRKSSKSLDIKGASVSNGAIVDQWTYTGATNQQFGLSTASNLYLTKNPIGGDQILNLQPLKLEEQAVIKPVVYPNPSSGAFLVSIAGDFDYVIHDEMGKVVEKGSGKDGLKIGESLKPGFYILQLKIKGELTLFKLIKQ